MLTHALLLLARKQAGERQKKCTTRRSRSSFTPILITDPVPNSQHTKQTNTHSPRPLRPNPFT